jgi:hypothetical protein
VAQHFCATVPGPLKRANETKGMMHQLGWTTLPGLKGLSVSEFRAAPTTAPDNVKGVAVDFATDQDRAKFLAQAEAEFSQRRFTNAADAFDTVKAYVLERISQIN